MKRQLSFFIFLFLLNSVWAQDSYFSQTNFSRLTTNPAYSGTDSAVVLSTGYRNQWSKLYYPYQTFYFSVDNYFHFMRAGLGFNYLETYEMKGAYTNTRYEFNYSPHIILSNYPFYGRN